MFNADKCKVMHIGRNNEKYEYTLDGVKMKTTNEEKDLGVWVDSSLKPTIQCEAAAKKANCVLGQIARAFHYRKKKTLVNLYKVFVRPHMEYAVGAWNPWTEKDCETLEKVQKRLIRMLSDVKGETYGEKLDDAGLTTLKERRKRGDLIETYKTMTGINKVNKNEWFEIVEGDGRATRGNTVVEDGRVEKKSNIICKKTVRMDIRKNFFTHRVVNGWNGLPEKIRSQRSLNAFKNELDAWMKKERDEDKN